MSSLVTPFEHSPLPDEGRLLVLPWILAIAFGCFSFLLQTLGIPTVELFR